MSNPDASIQLISDDNWDKAVGSAAAAAAARPTATSKSGKSGGFQSLGLSATSLRGVLNMGYRVPTPVQRKALPIALSGRDVVCMARTGSGKTCAFLLPCLEKLKEHDHVAGARAVILSPTRELALQTLRFAIQMSKYTTLKLIGLVGGDGASVGRPPPLPPRSVLPRVPPRSPRPFFPRRPRGPVRGTRHAPGHAHRHARAAHASLGRDPRL
jgi:hypothetical protein